MWFCWSGPIRPETLMSTVQASLRSRRRQYLIRDFLAQRRKTEKALLQSEKLAVAGRLAASIAHEINNPLESVTNLLFLIGTSSTLEEAKIYAATATDELARVSEIAIHTLKFFRQLSKPTRIYLTELVDSALVLYQARLDFRLRHRAKDLSGLPSHCRHGGRTAPGYRESGGECRWTRCGAAAL